MRADRRQFRASGAYQMPSGLSLGLAACYRARATGAGLDSANADDGYELSLTRGGAEGRRPAGYEASLQLDYPLSRRETKLNLLLDLNFLATDLDGRKAARVALLQPPPTALRLGLRVRF